MAGGARTNAKEPAAALLAAGRTVADTAKAVGVSERQVSRWQQEPGFRARVRELQKQTVGQAVAVLREGLTEAARELRDLLTHDSAAIRLRAADVLLRHSLGAFEVLDLMEQMEQIGERLDAQDEAMREMREGRG